MFNRTVNYAKAELRHYRRFERDTYGELLSVLSKITKENKKNIESYLYSREIKPNIKLDMSRFDKSTKDIIEEINSISGITSEINCILYLLMNHHPLTALTGVDDEWIEDKYTTTPIGKLYINKRFTNLKRLLLDDGTIKIINCHCILIREGKDFRRKGKLIDKFPYVPEPIINLTIEDIPDAPIGFDTSIKQKTNYNHYNVFKKLQGIRE